jgi:5-formyltetrahydrofolate cyclo-ligase
MKDEKQSLRTRVRKEREARARSFIDQASRIIQTKILQFEPFRVAESVGLYSPLQGEVGTEALRDAALASGKRVLYPKIFSGRSIALVAIRSAAELRPGTFGILEPAGGEPESEEETRGLVLFVPGVAFDPKGHRLGWGAGWYDRLLRRYRPGLGAVGLAFEFQVVETLPIEAWDQSVDYVVTESRLIDCAAHRAADGGSRPNDGMSVRR